MKKELQTTRAFRVGAWMLAGILSAYTTLYMIAIFAFNDNALYTFNKYNMAVLFLLIASAVLLTFVRPLSVRVSLIVFLISAAPLAIYQSGFWDNTPFGEIINSVWAVNSILTGIAFSVFLLIFFQYLSLPCKILMIIAGVSIIIGISSWNLLSSWELLYNIVLHTTEVVFTLSLSAMFIILGCKKPVAKEKSLS